MEQNLMLEGVFVKLRASITGLRMNTLRDLFLAFAEINSEFPVATDDMFETALNDCGLFLNRSDMWQIKRHFGQDSGLNCMKIFEYLREDLNEDRKRIIVKLFNFLSDGNDSIPLETVFEKYDAAKNPRVLSGMTSAARSNTQFKASFKEYPAVITVENFLDAFANIAPYYLDDDLFASTMCQCFGMVAKKGPKESDACAEIRGFLEEKLRQRSRGNESFKQTLVRVFKFFDMDQNGTISFKEFSKVFERLGLLLTDKVLKDLWEMSDVNHDGNINFKEWSGLILGCD